jgi:hypothetical protein
MASDLLQREPEASGAVWPERLSIAAPWPKTSRGLFVPLVFSVNVVVAILAWFIVELVMR